MSVSAWEAVFMLVVLKIPVVYLFAVVWWAVRAQPDTPLAGDDVGALAPLTPCGWDDWKRGRPRRRRPRRPLRGPSNPRVAASVRLS